jgi:hypothetical protein
MMQYKEGDVVFWRFKAPESDGSGTRYWCKSQYAIFRDVKDGRFQDTYWSGGDRFSFKPTDPEIEIAQYLGNLNDYNSCSHEEKRYYDKSDIMDISHPNDSKAVYLRKGAGKSAAVMFDTINKELARIDSEVDSLLRLKQRLQETHVQIQTSDDLSKIWL